MKKIYAIAIPLISAFSLANAETNLNRVSIDKKLKDLKSNVEVKSSKNHIFNSKYIENQSILNIKDILNRVPGVVTQESFSSIIIRGMQNFNSSQYTYGRHGAIGYQVDGIPLNPVSRMHISPIAWDINNVLVLKGAQPTAVLAPTMAGAVVVQTNEPSFDKDSLKTKAEIGLFNTYFTGATFNQKVNDKLAIRFSTSKEHSDGDVTFDIPEGTAYVDELTRTTTNGTKALKTDNLNISLKAKIRPSNGSEVNFRVVRDNATNDKYRPVSDLANLTTRHTLLSPNDFKNKTVYVDYKKPLSSSSSFDVMIARQSGRFVTNYGWLAKRTFVKSDSSLTDSSGKSLAGRQVTVGVDSADNTKAKVTFRKLDGSGSGSKSFDSQTESSGKQVKTSWKNANFENKNAMEKSYRTFDVEETTLAINYHKQFNKAKLSSGLAFDNLETNRFYDYEWGLARDKSTYKGTQIDGTKTISVKSDLTYPITNKITTLVGARFVIDKVNIQGSANGKVLNNEDKFLLPSLAVIYNFDPTTTFTTSYRYGYQSGGAKEITVSGDKVLKGYKAEKMKSLDIGVEKQFATKTLLSANLFYNKYTDKQESTGDYPNLYLANIGAGESKGFELGLDQKIGNSFDLSISYVNTSTKYTSGELEGKEFDLTPKSAYNINLSYASGMYFANTNINYRSQLKKGAVKAPASTIVDFKAGLKKNNIKYYVGINNQFNQRRISHIGNERADGKEHYYLGKLSSRFVFAGIEAEF